MMGPAELFYLTLLVTGVLYASMLAHFNGSLGTKRANTQIYWNSEIIVWIVLLVLVMSVIFRLLGPTALIVGAGTWFLIGAGNLMVVYIYLAIKLARHTLPANVFWIIVALSIVANIYALIVVFVEIIAGSLTPTEYANALELLLLLMTLILALVLLFNLVQSLWSSFLVGRSREAQSTERHTAIGVAIAAQIERTQSGSHQVTLEPTNSIIYDFGLRRIEDHGYKADLRVIRANNDQSIVVEVSNDKNSWEVCFIDEIIPSDWDVPYLNSPWRYVRITNSGSAATSISSVFDLD
ncbi:MAG: hypothetical protein GKR91_19830 [Pseudomonadales bacterium]|nr:hypothetical protein [Pseudomonadales bacterium]